MANRKIVITTLKKCLAFESDLTCFDVNTTASILAVCVEKTIHVWNLENYNLLNTVKLVIQSWRFDLLNLQHGNINSSGSLEEIHIEVRADWASSFIFENLVLTIYLFQETFFLAV